MSVRREACAVRAGRAGPGRAGWSRVPPGAAASAREPQWRIAGARWPTGARRRPLYAAAPAPYITDYPLRIRSNPVSCVPRHGLGCLERTSNRNADEIRCESRTVMRVWRFDWTISNDSRDARSESRSWVYRRGRSREWGRQYRLNRRIVRSLLRRSLWFLV